MKKIFTISLLLIGLFYCAILGESTPIPKPKHSQQYWKAHMATTQYFIGQMLSTDIGYQLFGQEILDQAYALTDGLYAKYGVQDFPEAPPKPGDILPNGRIQNGPAKDFNLITAPN